MLKAPSTSATAMGSVGARNAKGTIMAMRARLRSAHTRTPGRHSMRWLG